MKNGIRLITILLAVIMILSALTSCDILNLLNIDKDAIVTIEYYVDGELVKTEALTAEQITNTERYTPEEKSGYRFIGWFIDQTCEIPYDTTNLFDADTTKLYGKYLPIGTGTNGCDHFWILGYCYICEAVCDHEWKNAVCTICDMPCDHKDTKIGDTCETCDKELKEKAYKITVFTPDDEGNIEHTGELLLDTPMYIDEIVARHMTFWAYKFRNDIFDIKVNGKLIENGSMLISQDCTIIFAFKSDVIRISTTMIDTQGDRDEQPIYLPKEGITLERLGLIIFPRSGGFDKLLTEVDISIDGKKVTDRSYHINKSCSMTFTVKKGTDGNLEEKKISLHLEIVDTGSHFKGSFPVGIKLSLAIDELCGRVLERMLANGQVYLNGERIYENVELTSDAQVRYIELEEGKIIVNFLGSSDLGKGESVSKTTKVNAGITFEEIVYELFEMSWEEYEDRFYNTRITGNGDYTTWIPVYKDTVISNSVYIDAIGYYPHEKTDEVKLSIDITGIFNGEVTVPYDTLLSEAFKLFDPPLDFDTCLEEWDMFINTYALVSDSKLKYNSAIYGSKPCTKHEWRDRQCVKCGAICYNVYYDNADCWICGCYHPTERELIGITFQWVTASGDFKENSDVQILEGQPLEKVILKIDGRDLEEILLNNTVYMNDEEIVYFDCIVEEGAVIRIATDHCDHDWQDGHCRKCLRYCEHSFFEKSCTICDVEKQDPGVPVYVYLEVNNATLTEFEIEFGTGLEDVIMMAGYDSLESMLENGELKVYGHPVQVGDDLHLYGDERIYYMENKPVCSNHKWSNGVCTLCQTRCDYVYFDDGDCPICDSYHPQKSTDGKKISVEFYVYDESGKMIESNHKVEMPYGSHLEDAMGYAGWDDLDMLLKEGRLLVNSIEVKAGDVVRLYGGEKVEYFRGSPS